MMNKEEALKLAKRHFNDIVKTRPSDRTEAVRDAVKFWSIIVEALEK